MKFSTKAEYGMRAITNLTSNFPEVRSLRDVSKEEGVPFKYLEQLIGELRKADLVNSFKGTSGGYALSKEPDKITAGEIIEALEGPIRVMECSSSRCSSKLCQSKKVWLTLEKQIKKTLYSIKLSDLV